MHVSLILVAARNGVIGRGGHLPWRIKSDMRRFRAITMGKPMIMGRKQFTSVGKPLPGRDNIVVTRDRSFSSPGILVAHDFEAALALARTCAEGRAVDEIMVIGGAQIYALALPFADRIYLSRVEADVEGDVYVDLGDLAGWRVVSSERVAEAAGDDFGHEFSILERDARAVPNSG